MDVQIAPEEQPMIAAIQGAESPIIQALIQAFVDQLPRQVRVAGVIEDYPPETPDGECAPNLRNLRSGSLHALFQELGPCASSCALNAESVVAVCEEVNRDIAAGCDLVVLNKFAKLEAERSGLTAAFAASLEAGIPILTSVSPKFDAEWRRFAEPYFVILPPEPAAIARWWRAVSATVAA
jgi:hypothetical protein